MSPMTPPVPDHPAAPQDLSPSSPPQPDRQPSLARAWCVTLAVFLPMDALWLWWAGPRVYQPALGHLLAAQPQWGAALLFYALYGVGMVVFTVRPTAWAGSPWQAAGRGALFGLVAYATYDLTNQATLRDWPAWVTALDLAWGASVTAVATVLARALLARARLKPIDARRWSAWSSRLSQTTPAGPCPHSPAGQRRALTTSAEVFKCPSTRPGHGPASRRTAPGHPPPPGIRILR